MNKLVVTVWGRELSLDVVMDCYDEEEILPLQIKAYESILENWSVVEESLSSVQQYCIDHFAGQIEGGEVSNIFKYVVPNALFIQRNEEKRVVAVLCDFKFDFEHGLAIVFQNEKLADIGPQDIVL